MNAMKHIDKIREYCDYVEEHLDNVAEAWDIIQDKCADMSFITDEFLFTVIDEHVLNHDLSNASHEEFIPYVEKFFPVGEAKSDLFADAWQNHQDCNPHHWQTWTKLTDSFEDEWKCHAVCMVIDWVAMGIKFNDTARAYYEKNKETIDIPDEAVEFIYSLFNRVYT
jgi:hypothetical protein